MKDPSNVAAVAVASAAAAGVGAAEAFPASRPLALDSLVSTGSGAGSPPATAGRSPMGAGSRTVSGAGTPGSLRQGSGMGSLKQPGGGGAKEQGRFKVYEGDEPPPFRCGAVQRHVRVRA